MTTSTLPSRFVWLIALLWWAVPHRAFAADFATVTAISAPDTRGRWMRVQESAAAALVTNEQRTPLKVGMTLSLGDRIVTEESRVTIRLEKSEHITVSPGSDIVLQERSVLQQLGDVYYQVRNVFTVQYGTVQTAVEGTEFVVGGSAEAVEVTVTEGVVNVANAGERVRVRKGQRVNAATGSAPTAPTSVPANITRNLRSQAWTLGRPRLRVGMMASGGLYGNQGGGAVNYFAAIRLLPSINLVADGGHALTSDSLRTGSGLGLEWALGGFSVGGTAAVTVERWQYPCGGDYAALHLGGSIHGRYSIDLTRRFFLSGMGRAAANGDGLEATFGVGAGVSL